MNISHFLSSLTELPVLYVVCSLVIAVLIWVESAMLAHNGGKFPEHGAFGVVSLLTSVWLVISGLALYFLELGRFAISVPIVYAIYSVAGWIYGARLMRDVTIPDDPREIIVPMPYLSYSRGFAVAFAALCIFVLASPYLTFLSV